MYVQFTDSTETVICATAPSQQPATAWPYQGVVLASDARWATWYAGLPASTQAQLTPPTTPISPSLAQQASLLVGAGLSIASTSASGLNGIYGTNAAAQSNLLAVQVYLQANQKFPGTSGSMLWLDANNSPHTFTSTGQFTEFATAIADYVADLTLISMTGSGVLPPTTTTIA